MNKLKNGYLMRYLEDTMIFIKTMVFKLDDVAKLMNERIALVYGEQMVDNEDPTTWKYYMNLAGRYHPTDTTMQVVSIDTLETIDFTIENLRIHTATAEAYQYGTRQYYILLKKYPSQEFLISGILNPVDIDQAVLAEDGDIIAYRKDLVEINEHSLIAEFQQYIKYQLERWYNLQFNLSHDIYCATFLAAIQGQLVQKLLNLRLKRCHTYEAHSFHVRMFLASHNELDRYLPYLTLKQSLWLYRNIRYIERHSGILFQFYRLIEHLLTERGIPIGEYEVQQQDSFENYIPKIIAKSNPLNGEYNKLFDNTLPVNDLFTKETGDAPGNEQYLKFSQTNQLGRFNVADNASVQTKVLHSTMVDLTNAVPETFEDIAIRQWCHMANNGLYSAYVSFRDPKTSLTYSLPAKEAFFYMQYIALTMDGLELAAIPDYLNMRQRRHPKPTVDDLLSVVDYQDRDLRYIAEAIISRQPTIAPCLSTDAFTRLVYKLYDEAYWHWFVTSSMEDYFERGLVENMIHQLYEDERVCFNFSTNSVAVWLAENNLPAYDYSRTEAQMLVKAIFEAGAGIAVNGARMLKNVQKALIELTKELSSYTVQFVREINDNDMILVDWPAIRFGNQKMKQDNSVEIRNGVIVMDGPTHVNGEAFVGTDAVTRLKTDVTIEPNETAIYVDSLIDEQLTTSVIVSVRDLDSSFYIDITYTGQNETVDDQARVPGISIYEGLPAILKHKVKSIYSEVL